MVFSTKWLAEILPEHKGAAKLNIDLNDVCTDASVSMNKGLFVPIQEGNHTDSLKAAISNGAVASLWKKNESVPAFVPTDFPVFLVEDMGEAILNIAKAYVHQKDLYTVCITGVSGAAETKRYVASILNQRDPIYVINQSINTELQLALELLNLPLQTKTCVVEFDLIDSDRLFDLSFIANPDIGVITAVSHVESDLVQKCVEMFAGLKKNGKVVLDGDEPAFSAIHQRENVLTCGFHHGNEAMLVQEEFSNVFTVNREKYELKDSDTHFIRYAGYAIIVGYELGLEQTAIQQGLTNLNTSSG